MRTINQIGSCQEIKYEEIYIAINYWEEKWQGGFAGKYYQANMNVYIEELEFPEIKSV